MNGEKASAILTESSLQKIMALAKPNSAGHKILRIQLAEEQSSNVGSFEVTLPAAAFLVGASTLQLEINTSLATFVLPDNLFPAKTLDNVKTVTLLLKPVDTTGSLKKQLGESLLIDYELLLDGTTVQLESLNSAIQIGLPYPAAVPPLNNAFIVVWNVNEHGVIQPVVGGNYDSDKKQAIFSTTNLSGQYAAVYNHKTFRDISDSHWAKFIVEVLTSKGVINGVTETEFRPDQTVTRADFALLLVRALGLSAAEGNSFADVSPNDYFYEGLMTAQKLGVVTGQTDGLYHPHDSISRQEMFVMAARALKAAEVWESNTTASSPLH